MTKSQRPTKSPERNWSLVLGHLFLLRFDHYLAGERAAFVDRAFFLQAVRFGGLVEWQDAVDARFDFSFDEPAADGFGGGALLVGGGVEDGEAQYAAVFSVERSDRKR